MGVADRDWYRDEMKRRTHSSRNAAGRPAFGRRRGPALGLTGKLVALLVVFVFGIKAHGWWQAREQAQTLEPPSGQTFPHPSAAARAESRAAAAPENVDAPLTDAARQSRQVFKCIVNGRVTYAGPLDCRSGISANVATETPLSEAPAGGLSEYQREMLRSADARIAADHAAAQAQITAQQNMSSTKQAECAALQQQISSLDSWARQPLVGSQQDTIRRDRSQLTSRQYALRC